MYETLSYCGLECTGCPAFIATRDGDAEAIARVAAEWSKDFGMEIPPESIECEGCKSETGRLSGYCNICAVRACASGRGVITCAHCDDYGCETLLLCPAYLSRGKEELEKIRSASG